MLDRAKQIEFLYLVPIGSIKNKKGQDFTDSLKVFTDMFTEVNFFER